MPCPHWTDGSVPQSVTLGSPVSCSAMPPQQHSPMSLEAGDKAIPTTDAFSSPSARYDELKDPENGLPVVPTLEEEPVKAEPTPAPNAPAKILFLDGIRGAAAILVVCQHMFYLAGMKVGALGVDTFFVLSAYLLTMIFEKKLRVLYNERAPLTRWLLALVDYGVRRILRVYPLFAVVVFVISVSSDKHKQQWWEVSKLGDDFSVFKMLTFVPGYRFYVLWTLPLELTYYLLIPVFALAIVLLRCAWWLPIIPLLYWIIHSGLYDFRTAGGPLWSQHIPTFVCGSVAAILYNRASDCVQKHKFVFRWWHLVVVRAIEVATLLLLVSVVFNALIFDWYGPYPYKTSQNGDKGDHFVSVYISLIIICEMLAPGVISAVFEWNVLRFAGKISFSMYLLHPRIIHSDFLVDQKNWYTKYFSLWILVFFWSTLSFYAIEYPSQWVATWIGKKIKALDAKEKAKTEHRFQLVCLKKERPEEPLTPDVEKRGSEARRWSTGVQYK